MPWHPVNAVPPPSVTIQLPKALAACEVQEKKEIRPWKENHGLMEFLRLL